MNLCNRNWLFSNSILLTWYRNRDSYQKQMTHSNEDGLGRVYSQKSIRSSPGTENPQCCHMRMLSWWHIHILNPKTQRKGVVTGTEKESYPVTLALINDLPRTVQEALWDAAERSTHSLSSSPTQQEAQKYSSPIASVNTPPSAIYLKIARKRIASNHLQ